MNQRNLARRAAALVPALVLAGALAACGSVLDVQNPGAVGDQQLDDTLNAPLFTSTVVSDFQRAYDDLARDGSWLTDETVSGHNFVGFREWDGRIMDQQRTELRDIYTTLHQARFSADSLFTRYKQFYPSPTPVQSLNLARMRAYGGYTYVMLGEYFCESPLRETEAALPSAELSKLAIPRFQEAIQLATAAKTGTGAVAAARADSIINLARVGLARTYLQLGDRAKAVEFASQVPASFEFRAFYSESKDYAENLFYSSTTGANQNMGVDVKFRNLWTIVPRAGDPTKRDTLYDPRVRHTATSRTGHNGSTPLFRPYEGESFSDWKPGTGARGDTINFTKNTSIRFASGLEARYIVAEAGGMTDAQLLDFINERRAVGKQGTFTGTDLQAELRDQRRRDFFMDGHRLGDIRRYKAQYKIDEFPTGAHPDPFIGTYGTAECFIPSIDERNGNPNY
ncbi:MAG: hypothetical protein JO040_12575 [Gemmatimonadetes bacterium]|nr:hypothetical protein [Gemmatimonadota bacterium]